MSSTSRKLPADVLAHPEVVALLQHGKDLGQVSAQAVRDASESAAVTPQHLRALLRHLSEEGVSVVVSAEDSGKRAVAASKSRSTVSAAAKKAPAKKTPAKKAVAEPAKKAPVKKAAAKKATAPAAKSAPAKAAPAKAAPAKRRRRRPPPRRPPRRRRPRPSSPPWSP